MKNKKFTYYVLVPSVIVVWGLIIYKIVVKDNGVANKYIPQTSDRTQIKTEDIEYSLLDNYPDPFLAKKEVVVHKKPTVTATANKTVQQQQPWPTIKFNGYVVNGNVVKAHVTINGENKILKTNEPVLEGYTISVITNDSILVKHSSGMKWFHK